MAYIGRQQDGFGVRSRFIYTATGGQTTFTTDDSGNALSYSDGAYVDVYLNGVLLDPADYTDTSLTSIVLGSGATASDILEVIVYDVFSVFSGTFTNGITANTATITDDMLIAKSTVDSNLSGHIFSNNGSAIHTRDGGLVFVLNRLTDDGALAAFRKDGTTVGSIGSVNGDVFFAGVDDNHAALRLAASSKTMLPVTTAGALSDNTTDLGQSNGRFKDLYLGGGAYIGGTGSANLLDDYEEGTWTPAYGFTTSGATITYDKATGEYVKIGRQVIARFQIRTDAFSGGSGSAVIGGFPFTASTNASGTGTAQRAGGLLVNYASGFTTEAPQTGYVNDGNDYAILITNSSSDARDDLDNGLGPTNFTNSANSNFLMGTVFFTV